MNGPSYYTALFCGDRSDDAIRFRRKTHASVRESERRRRGRDLFARTRKRRGGQRIMRLSGGEKVVKFTVGRAMAGSS